MLSGTMRLAHPDNPSALDTIVTLLSAFLLSERPIGWLNSGYWELYAIQSHESRARAK